MSSHNNDLYVKDTGDRGRGVFANRPFKKDEVVEECPVLPFQYSFDLLPKGLQHYLFSWHTVKGLDWHAVALGYGSLYNHNNPANLRAEIDGNKQVIRFLARKDVEKDQELTINYNDVSGECKDDLRWFESKGINPILTRE